MFLDATTGGDADQRAKLDQDVTTLLLSDLEQKLLEVIQESSKVMRQSKRDVLTSSDVASAMKKLTIPESYGYPSSVSFPFSSRLTHEQQNIWFHTPQSINLREFATKAQPSHLKLSYHKYMTAVDGHQPEIAENVREIPNFEPPTVHAEHEVLTVAQD